MLHTTSPSSKPDRRASLGAATALAARNISGTTNALGNRANGHSRAVSDSRDLLPHVRVHRISGPSPSLSALSSSPPLPQHPPKKPSSLPDSSNIQPGCFDTLSVDTASVTSADSVGQPRVRRLCSPEISRRPFVPPPCRQTTNPRSSQSKELGGTYTGRLTEQALRDQEAVQRGDLGDTVSNTHVAPYQTINSTPQKPTSQSFGEDTIMASSTREGYGGTGLTSRDRSRSFASTHSDPTQKAEGGAESIAQGTVSKAFGSRPGRLPFGRGSNASASTGNNEDNKHGEFSRPTVEGSEEKVKSTEGNVDSISGNKPILASTASNPRPPFRSITARAEGKARSAQEQGGGNGKRRSGSPSNAPRHGLTFTAAAGTRANPSPKDSKAPRQAASTLHGPSPDRHLPRRDKGHITKPDVSPTAAKQQSQKPSHKRNATTSSIHRTFSGEHGVGKTRDERNRSSSAASVWETTARGKPASRSVSTTSTVEVGNSTEVARSEAIVTDANLAHPTPAETLETMRKESRTGRSSSTSSWTDLSDPGAEFSSREPERNRRRNSGASSPDESALSASNDRYPNFEAHAQESSPEIDVDKPARIEFGGFTHSFLKRPSEADYEDLTPASRAGTVQMPRYTPTPSPSKRRDARKKIFKIPRGLQDIKLARKSPLEEEDSDVDSLQYLMENDQDFSALFTPADDDEDNTALILANLPTYKPPTAQKLKVRSRAEAEAGDQMWEQERAVHEKLMNRLRTLHLEVRSATRGLDVLEGFLDGAGSSGDLSECWDDAAQRKEYMRRLRKEEQKQRLLLDRRVRQRVALLGTSLPWSKWLVKWGFIAFLVVLVWYLLELAVFLHSMPPSYSSVAIERKPPPEFGALFSHAILKPAKYIFNSSTWLIQHAIMATINLTSRFLSAIFGPCKDTILNLLLYSWHAVTAITTALFSSLSTSSSSPRGASEAVYTAVAEYADVAAAGMPQALGSDHVLN